MSTGDNWFPSRNRMVMEILATTIGVIGASILISRIPFIKQLVDGNSIWSLTNGASSTTTTTS
ncbi:hypothetical protein SAMN02787142_1245 [Burkholderia sp. WP9]|uniref:hypothetical protein n=1 Tax=Burkholderiaceae TaxID=119060 RepID=UPI0008952A41|nr:MULTISPECIES: hypothetical protein [Burkholderiaceae]MBK3741174.1 hypothetical protein [Paraburkholderia aspalathi]CAE6746586.1 hypothetical protein R69619_02726 [Paraburkholderia nemoris]SEC35349.1 hypothetical protein SAMN02787142_1245 [Burkholderia sp. WP9]